MRAETRSSIDDADAIQINQSEGKRFIYKYAFLPDREKGERMRKEENGGYIYE